MGISATTSSRSSASMASPLTSGYIAFPHPTMSISTKIDAAGLALSESFSAASQTARRRLPFFAWSGNSTIFIICAASVLPAILITSPVPSVTMPSLDCVLVEEFCYGTPLTDFIVKAIREGAREALFRETDCSRLFSRHYAQQDRYRRPGGLQQGLLLLRPDHGSVEKLGTYRMG